MLKIYYFLIRFAKTIKASRLWATWLDPKRSEWTRPNAAAAVRLPPRMRPTEKITRATLSPVDPNDRGDGDPAVVAETGIDRRKRTKCWATPGSPPPGSNMRFPFRPELTRPSCWLRRRKPSAGFRGRRSPGSAGRSTSTAGKRQRLPLNRTNERSARIYPPAAPVPVPEAGVKRRLMSATAAVDADDGVDDDDGVAKWGRNRPEARSMMRSMMKAMMKMRPIWGFSSSVCIYNQDDPACVGLAIAWPRR